MTTILVELVLIRRPNPKTEHEDKDGKRRVKRHEQLARHALGIKDDEVPKSDILYALGNSKAKDILFDVQALPYRGGEKHARQYALYLDENQLKAANEAAQKCCRDYRVVSYDATIPTSADDH